MLPHVVPAASVRARLALVAALHLAALVGGTGNNVLHVAVSSEGLDPGVTGWAQISGWRGEIDNDDKIRQRVACDLYYIENWSLLLDLKILFLTPIRLLNTENAY